MDQKTIKLTVALLRSAVCGELLTEEEKAEFSDELLSKLYYISKKHDVANLTAFGLKKNGIIKSSAGIDNEIIKAVYRYEQLNYDYENLCKVLESAKIQFIPLKGSVLRKYYPEPWMRTSCDIDILVHRDDLDKAMEVLTETLQYTLKEHGTHDVTLITQQGVNIELHFNLVEEGRANRASEVLSTVWDNVMLHDGYEYWYEMTDAFFYFYHIAHMAKHFEHGGCGIRPFIDLWILDNISSYEKNERDKLLESGELFKFAETSRKLAKVWFERNEADELVLKLQDYIIIGGVYGTAENRVAIQQKKKGGRIGYLFSRIFIPYSRLKLYYPILEKHRWLMPVMQVRRWFMIFRPDVAKRTKSELSVNSKLQSSVADDMKIFLDDIGIN